MLIPMDPLYHSNALNPRILSSAPRYARLHQILAFDKSHAQYIIYQSNVVAHVHWIDWVDIHVSDSLRFGLFVYGVLFLSTVRSFETVNYALQFGTVPK